LERKNETSDFFQPKKEDNLISVLHSNEANRVKVKIDDSFLSLTSFPWEEFPTDLGQLEKIGKAYFVYPQGINMQSLDILFREELLEIAVKFTIKTFKFKKDLIETSNDNLRTIGQHFRENNLIKFKKRKDITYVGVHHRRGDHVALQKEARVVPLEAGYFLEAMDMYREKYKRVIFIYVSDDVNWGKTRLLPRVKTGDLYFVGDLLLGKEAHSLTEQGRDLAVLAACNHTVLSYGTYGFWGGFLAGHGTGYRLTPPFFSRYRTETETSKLYWEHPFNSSLPRFYYGMKFLR